mmetsp:Transcript_23583/g.39547  ORF Transcript_23583/g.39547 Transcript_23583/m.39547 type:complete len:355 (-) Transcript_23583:1229-2293(-)
MEGVLADGQLAELLAMLVVAQAHAALRVVLLEHRLAVAEGVEPRDDRPIQSLATCCPGLCGHEVDLVLVVHIAAGAAGGVPMDHALAHRGAQAQEDGRKDAQDDAHRRIEDQLVIIGERNLEHIHTVGAHVVVHVEQAQVIHPRAEVLVHQVEVLVVAVAALGGEDEVRFQQIRDGAFLADQDEATALLGERQLQRGGDGLIPRQEQLEICPSPRSQQARVRLIQPQILQFALAPIAGITGRIVDRPADALPRGAREDRRRVAVGPALLGHSGGGALPRGPAAVARAQVFPRASLCRDDRSDAEVGGLVEVPLVVEHPDIVAPHLHRRQVAVVVVQPRPVRQRVCKQVEVGRRG